MHGRWMWLPSDIADWIHHELWCWTSLQFSCSWNFIRWVWSLPCERKGVSMVALRFSRCYQLQLEFGSFALASSDWLHWRISGVPILGHHWIQFSMRSRCKLWVLSSLILFSMLNFIIATIHATENRIVLVQMSLNFELQRT